MIPTPHRAKGACALGARHPGEQGPFGVWPEDDGQADETEPAGDPMTYRAEGGPHDHHR